MPEGLTQTKTPTSKTPAGFKSECRPVSFRNGGRLQIGTMAGFKSEYPAEINRNPHSSSRRSAEKGPRLHPLVLRVGTRLAPFGATLWRERHTSAL